jgi:hypothetical protein
LADPWFLLYKFSKPFFSTVFQTELAAIEWCPRPPSPPERRLQRAWWLVSFRSPALGRASLGGGLGRPPSW